MRDTGFFGFLIEKNFKYFLLIIIMILIKYPQFFIENNLVFYLKYFGKNVKKILKKIMIYQ